MAKYLGIIGGAIVLILGITGLIGWRPEFVTVMKGSLPLLAIFGGAIAIVAGVSEIRDEAGPKK